MRSSCGFRVYLYADWEGGRGEDNFPASISLIIARRAEKKKKKKNYNNNNDTIRVPKLHEFVKNTFLRVPSPPNYSCRPLQLR